MGEGLPEAILLGVEDSHDGKGNKERVYRTLHERYVRLHCLAKSLTAGRDMMPYMVTADAGCSNLCVGEPRSEPERRVIKQYSGLTVFPCEQGPDNV